MSYLDERRGAQRAIGIGVVGLLHAGLIWALTVGLAEKPVDVAAVAVKALFVDVPQPREANPRPAVETPPPAVTPPPAARPPVAPPPRPASPQPTMTSPPADAAPAVRVPTEAASTAMPPRADPDRPNRKPPYPPSSKRLGEEGTVVLLLHVAASGEVDEARLDRSSGFAKLDEAAARQAMKSWHFIPATRAGAPVAAWHRFTVTFRLTDD